MTKTLYGKIRNIFVGREEELTQLQNYWESVQNTKEHEIFVLLNAPGVGKSVLLHKFGQIIQEQQSGLFIQYNSAQQFKDPKAFISSLMNTIYTFFMDQRNYIEEYINKKFKEPEKKEDYDFRLNMIIKEIKSVMQSDNPHIFDISECLKGISRIIPVFIMVDEIQNLQSLDFINENEQKESYLHYLTRILQSLLKERILVILSGTKYHILNNIGYKIGSPIRGKVVPIVISNLNEHEIELYTDEIACLIKNSLIEISEKKNGNKSQKPPIVVNKLRKTLINNYRRFIFAFSGGHGRTIEQITKYFVENIDFFIKNFERYSIYNEFLEYMFKNIYLIIKEGILTKEIEEELNNLATNKHFSFVKSWLINRAYSGFKVGKIPSSTHIRNNIHYSQESQNIVKSEDENVFSEEEIDSINDIVYSLMNIGIIFRNGHQNYYITSYFHLIRFIQIYEEEHHIFLKQILNNKYFKLMCGSHGGFGYTFENIIIAVLFISKTKDKEIQHKLPFDNNQLRDVITIKNKINWNEYIIKENVLYSTPFQKGVDLFILQGKKLYLIQLTTQKHNKLKKLESFNASVEKIKKLFGQNNKKNTIEYQIHACFFSLYPIKQSIKEKFNFEVFDSLERILGKKLYVPTLKDGDFFRNLLKRKAKVQEI